MVNGFLKWVLQDERFKLATAGCSKTKINYPAASKQPISD
jgi:hypothetical protein